MEFSFSIDLMGCRAKLEVVHYIHDPTLHTGSRDL